MFRVFLTHALQINHHDFSIDHYKVIQLWVFVNNPKLGKRFQDRVDLPLKSLRRQRRTTLLIRRYRFQARQHD
ncbi:hypothetical protein NLG97_g9856 [Lecanicillium saksenae]|uniref:Uncharacterized protein n=1 Tax=Lecanicillium saksenae TaxID=468837 RepID=A0ACC1QGB4_9HYPO|nr:hypothetical protein NLG97_g9856 [Lecanicillium saksenae]